MKNPTETAAIIGGISTISAAIIAGLFAYAAGINKAESKSPLLGEDSMSTSFIDKITGGTSAPDSITDDGSVKVTKVKLLLGRRSQVGSREDFVTLREIRKEKMPASFSGETERTVAVIEFDFDGGVVESGHLTKNLGSNIVALAESDNRQAESGAMYFYFSEKYAYLHLFSVEHIDDVNGEVTLVTCEGEN